MQAAEFCSRKTSASRGENGGGGGCVGSASSTQKHAAKAAKAEARRLDEKSAEVAALLVSKNKNVRQTRLLQSKAEARRRD